MKWPPFDELFFARSVHWVPALNNSKTDYCLAKDKQTKLLTKAKSGFYMTGTLAQYLFSIVWIHKLSLCCVVWNNCVLLNAKKQLWKCVKGQKCEVKFESRKITLPMIKKRKYFFSCHLWFPPPCNSNCFVRLFSANLNSEICWSSKCWLQM